MPTYAMMGTDRVGKTAALSVSTVFRFLRGIDNYTFRFNHTKINRREYCEAPIPSPTMGQRTINRK